MPLRVTDRLVTDVAARLGDGGRWPYSPRQLYYAVCAEVEQPHLSTGRAQAGCGALLILLSIVGGAWASIYVGLVVIPGLVVLGMGLQAVGAERRRPTTRPLAMAWEEFVSEHLEPLRRADPDALAGLLDTAAPVPAAQTGPMLVCDRADSVPMVAAIAGAAGLDVRVVAEDAADSIDGRAIVLHDADPRGCGLALRLRTAGIEAVDAGLRPGQLTRRRVQVLEGAPAMVPGDTGALLTPDEIVWLAEGRRVELATLSPALVAAAVRAALAVRAGDAGSGDLVAAEGAQP